MIDSLEVEVLFPVRPSPRHAQLAVNLAGAMATFIVETWIARNA